MEIVELVKNSINGLQSDGIEKITSIIALALLGFLVVSSIKRMIKGFRAGTRRQVLSTSMILISVIAAMILTRLTSSKLINLVSVDNIHAVINRFGLSNETVTAYIDILAEVPTETLRYISAIIVAVLLAPILFVIVYGIVRFITFIIQRIIRSSLKIKGPANLAERFSGLALGTVESIIVCSVILLPATSIVSFADEVVTTISVANSESGGGENSDFAEFEKVYTTYLEPAVIDNPTFRVANMALNNTVTSTISTISTGGESENIREEFMDIIEIILVDIPEMKGVDFKNPDDEEKELISALVDRLADNKIITTILSGTISTTAKIFDLKTFGIDLDPPLDSVADDVMDILASCSADTLKADLHLIKDIYFMLADTNVLTSIDDGDQLLEALISKQDGEDKSAVQKLIALINENERTKPLITTLTKLSITMLASQLGNSEFVAEETYESLKATMNNVLSVDSNNYETREEYIDAVTDTLDANLQANGIVIEEREILTNIAEYIDNNYGESNELSDEEFNDVLLSYFDAYLEYQENGTLPDDILPPGVNPDDIPGDFQDNQDGGVNLNRFQ